MKILIKIFLVFLVASFFSCNSDDSNGAIVAPTPVVFAMKGTLDAGITKLMRNLEGTDKANPSSTEFGLDYFTLYGYYDNSSPDARAPIQDKIVEINIAIPKNNISVGEHLFNNTLVADEYFADMNIKLDNVSETVNTVSGKINVITFDDVTGKITGTYEFTTTNGSTPQTHSITGEFNYILLDF